MKKIGLLLMVILLAGCPLDELLSVRAETNRFHKLSETAKQHFINGNIAEADSEAKELLRLAPKFQRNWNYGNAIHDANLVLGRIALTQGLTNDAKMFLIAAGNSSGSPQLNSFGPNLTLAKDLLEKGEREVVLAYFQLIRRFWQLPHNRSRLSEWEVEVKAGRVPNFGPNLHY